MEGRMSTGRGRKGKEREKRERRKKSKGERGDREKDKRVFISINPLYLT